MANAKLNFTNQFGETTSAVVLPGSAVATLPAQAANTVVMNNTGGAAIPTAVTVQNTANALPAKAGITAIAALATPVAPITVATAGGNTYSDAAMNVALAAVVADLQTQLTRINLILAQLKVVS